MIQQLDLMAYRQPALSEVETFCAHLYGRGWQTARELKQSRGWNDRSLRAWAAASEGKIISGQRGYCLLEEATAEEINHAHAWLISQGKAMIKRGLQIKKRAHAKVG